jgi:hypothetical protein
MSEGQFFDPRISNRAGIRNKKSLRFNQPGKFTQMADRMRMKVFIIIQKILSGSNT